jgi:hypothetical protein
MICDEVEVFLLIYAGNFIKWIIYANCLHMREILFKSVIKKKGQTKPKQFLFIICTQNLIVYLET